MNTPSAAILAIGTELTTGQILNRNASWISKRMMSLGVETQIHLSIPDDRAQIKKELTRLESPQSQVDLLFVTGGLGPTTDDFTRECIAQWADLELIWDEGTWEWIQARLSERKVKVRDFQKQQCYFPQGAHILNNAKGTAHGFRFSKGALEVFVLPGPPREVENIWEAHIHPWLQKKYPDIDRRIVRSWDCFGVGESEVAHRAEIALKNCSFEKGYRVHLPYVEFKLSYLQSQAEQAVPYVEAVEKALLPWVVARDGHDPSQLWLESLKNFDQIFVSDQVTEGTLMERLVPHLKELGLSSKTFFLQSESFDEQNLRQISLTLTSASDSQARLSWQTGKKRHSIVVESPYSTLLMREREKQFFAEKAILFWASMNPLC